MAELAPFSLETAQVLLSTYGSPLYVYQSDRLRQNIRYITESIPYPYTQFRFASVTNGNIALLQIFRREGWGLHANTPGDIYLGLQAGFDPQHIVYSGSNLNRTEMEQVRTWGITTLNLDSLAQLQLCCDVYTSSPSPSPLHLGLRLNLPELTGDSRIGVRPQEFPAAISIARQAGLPLTGLHFYRGTGTNATQSFTNAIDTVLSTAQQLPDWQYLDFGGGFGYPYQHGSAAFDWPEFGAQLSDRLSQQPRKIELIVEPGRAAIAGCAVLLAQVVSVKWQGDLQVVGVDTTVTNLSVPSVHGGYREIFTWQRSQTLYSTNVCGNTTYSRDYLGKNCQLPALEIGNIIGLLDVGAYGYAMSSHFLHRPRPAEVLLDPNGRDSCAPRVRLIRQRETYDVLLERQIFSSSH